MMINKIIKCCLIVFICLLTLVGFSSQASADTVIRYVDAAADPNGDGESWETAEDTLQGGLDTAEGYLSENPGDIVQLWLKAGTYHPSLRINPSDPRTATFRMRDSVGIYGGFEGDEPPSGFLLRNPTANEVILDGDIGTAEDPDDNAYHIITAMQVHTSALIDGCSIQNGNADGAPDPTTCISDGQGGGGMLVIVDCEEVSKFTTPTILRCVFRDNQADFGGAVFIHGDEFEIVTFSNCLFENNTAVHGGAIQVDGDKNLARFLNCLFIFNTSTGENDLSGTIRCAPPASVGLFNCTVTRNSSGIAHTGEPLQAPPDGGFAGFNNIIFNNGNRDFDNQIAGSNWCLSYSCIDDFDNHPDMTGICDNADLDTCFEDNPQFVNSNSDFHLNCGPCVNTASSDEYLSTSAWYDSNDLDQDTETEEPTPDLDLQERVVAILDMGSYERQMDPCLIDIEPSGVVDVDDLLAVINAWGNCDPAPAECPADISPEPCGNGVVDTDDLLVIINNWGIECATGEWIDVGSLSSVQDCMDRASARYTPYSSQWTTAVNLCVHALCVQEIIECDD